MIGASIIEYRHSAFRPRRMLLIQHSIAAPFFRILFAKIKRLPVFRCQN